MDITSHHPHNGLSSHPEPSPLSPTSSTISSTSSSIPTKKKPSKKAAAVSKPRTSTAGNRGERMTFELDDVLRKYSPEQFKTCKAYDVGGVNILNKKPIDSKTALDKIKRRRETHNRVERRRRDCINQLIDELTSLLPRDDGDSKCHRVNVLRTAVAHIQNLTRHNENLHQQLEALQTGKPMPPPAIITTLAPMVDDGAEEEDDEEEYSSTNDHRTDTSPSLSYSSHVPSPVSPYSPSPNYSPYPPSSPMAHQEWGPSLSHLAPLNLPVSVSSESTPVLPRPVSQAASSVQLPGIPMIIEPSESTVETGSHAKRLNRQTLPRLQLAPPPFHHRRPSNSGTGSAGGYKGPGSPSYYGQDSLTSPASTYSGYSSTSGPWSSTSSLGPFSANSSGPGSFATSPHSPGYSPYGPPSPYSPYGPPPLTRSPGLGPWGVGGGSEAS
ncbi:hypothetical protein BG005_000268 [Podila minutissima]|nr:hypothetical protein BG005_000268 [Podila minutissima]